MKLRLLAGALAVFLHGCGGASAPTPTPTPTDTIAFEALFPNRLGSEQIPTTRCPTTPEICSVGLVISAQVRSVSGIESAQLYMQLFDEAGNQCGTGLSEPVSVPANASRELAVFQIVLSGCAFPVRTRSMRATLFGPNPSSLPPSLRASRDWWSVSAGWLFAVPTF